MKIEIWAGSDLIEGSIKKEDLSKVISLLTDIKSFIKPKREPDFKHDGIEYYTNEGLAFSGNRYANDSYDAFYSSKRDQVGLRLLSKGRNKRNAVYQDQKLSKEYKSAVAENIILLGMDEPENFGKVPKKR